MQNLYGKHNLDNYFTSLLLLFNFIMKFTNCILPLETTAPKSHYLSAYAAVDLNSINETATKTIVTQLNQLLRIRFQQVKMGVFDNVDLDWAIPQLSTLHVKDISRTGIEPYRWGKPADDYLPLMKNAIPKFNATFLNKQFNHWPVSFKHINENIRSDDYHISFMPVIRFPNNNLQIASLITKFMKVLDGIPSFEVKTTGKFSLFAKWDMKKVFLGLEIEQNDNLDKIIKTLQDFRLDLPDPGVAMGENDGFILNWVNSTPHITIGVWTSSYGNDKFDLNNSLFGFWELLYINEVLIESADKLKDAFPDIKSFSLEGKCPEIPIMSFQITNATLIANGQKLRKRFT